MKNKVKKNYYSLILLFVFLLLLYLLFNHTNFYIPCFFHKLTSLYCPGCGITRMFIFLFKLDFKNAFESNQLVFLLLPVLLIYFILEIRRLMTNKINFMNSKKFKIAWIFLTILALLFGILRNTDEFSFLSP